MRKLLAALCIFISGCCCHHQGVDSRHDSWNEELERSQARLGARAMEAYWEMLGEGLAESGAGLDATAPPEAWSKLRDRKAFLYKMRVHADNLMNVCTLAFKRSRVIFTSDHAHGVTVSEERIFTQGTTRRTEMDLDVAIDGEGFFRVQLPDNTIAFLRAGNFNVDSQGNLVTPKGYPLDPPVTVPQNITRIVIDQTGLVQGFDPQTPDTLQAVGQLELSRFVNPSGLEAMGDNLYRETPAAGNRTDGQPGQGQGFGPIRQGFLEESNVDIQDEALELRRAMELYKLLGHIAETPVREEAKGKGD